MSSTVVFRISTQCLRWLISTPPVSQRGINSAAMSGLAASIAEHDRVSQTTFPPTVLLLFFFWGPRISCTPRSPTMREAADAGRASNGRRWSCAALRPPGDSDSAALLGRQSSSRSCNRRFRSCSHSARHSSLGAGRALMHDPGSTTGTSNTGGADSLAKRSSRIDASRVACRRCRSF